MTDYSAYHWAKKAEEWAQQAAGVTSVNGKTGTVTLDASDVGAQETLVSGTNIKTINNSTILGSGNLDIDGMPDQTGNAGKFLTTDGTDASWAVPKIHNLFDFMWRDAELNDMSWLRADTFSWQDGTVYTEAYNHLVDDIDGKTATSETVGSYTISYYLADDGHKITTDETTVANIYNESGVSWYYILDTANQRFKLPRENPNKEELINLTQAPVVFGTKIGSSTLPSGSVPANYVNSGGGNLVGYYDGANFYSYPNGNGSTFKTDLSNATSTSIYKGKQYLYFYVGQFSQTATEQTAGLNSELFNGKVDLDAANLSTAGKSLISGLGMPSDRYENLTLGASYTTYTAPANGYVFIRKAASTAGQYLYLYSSSYLGFQEWSSTNSPTGYFQVTIPVRKGETFVVAYTMGGGTDYFRFVYAEGEENV